MLGPFEVLKRPLTLRSPDAKPAANGSGQAGSLAWWKFDETDGVTVSDAAGNRHNGMVQGPPLWKPDQGVQGGALEFDGARSWVECSDSDSLELRDALSISAWFKGRSSDQPLQTLMAKGEAWRLQRQGDKGQLEFALIGPQTTGASKSKPPTILSKRKVEDDLWHHVAGVYDGQRMVLYLDGVADGAVSATGPIAVNNVPVTLGENGLSRGRFFNGWLDNARLYGRALSADEVRRQYQERAPQ